MRYVLDASAALCWVLPRPNSGKALQLRADFQNAVHELIAPSVFSGEVGTGPLNYASLECWVAAVLSPAARNISSHLKAGRVVLVVQVGGELSNDRAAKAFVQDVGLDDDHRTLLPRAPDA